MVLDAKLEIILDFCFFQTLPSKDAVLSHVDHTQDIAIID